MGYYSSVYGDVDFKRKPQVTDEATAAERAALAEQLRALGGAISFEDEEVPKAFLDALRDEKQFGDINYVFDLEYLEEEPSISSNGEGGKVYNLEKEFRVLVKIAEQHGVLANGIVTVTGEEAGDIWRLVIKDNVVEHEETKVIWPDGTEYKP